MCVPKQPPASRLWRAAEFGNETEMISSGWTTAVSSKSFNIRVHLRDSRATLPATPFYRAEGFAKEEALAQAG
jgi:hypothetical protein